MRSDIEQPIFSERLWPSRGIWAAAIGFGAALGLIPAPIDTAVAYLVGFLGAVGMGVLFALTTPSLLLTETDFAAGRARIPLDVVAAVEVLDADHMKLARGATLDARAYLCIRGWLPVGVKLIVTDVDDPTPYWLISSRDPQALAAAVNARLPQARTQV